MNRTVTTGELHKIDWAAVAARARANLGEEGVARISDRLRKTMMLTGMSDPRDSEQPGFDQPPPSE